MLRTSTLPPTSLWTTQEIGRREKADSRLLSIVAERDAERRQHQTLELHVSALQEEVDAADLALSRLLSAAGQADAEPADLSGVMLLYVGGRAHQLGQLRRLAEGWSATFLHHDGGIDDRSGRLDAQVARAEARCFRSIVSVTTRLPWSSA